MEYLGAELVHTFGNNLRVSFVNVLITYNCVGDGRETNVD